MLSTSFPVVEVPLRSPRCSGFGISVVLKLADGSVVRLEAFDRLNALLSRVNGENHWLAYTLEKSPDDAPPDDLEIRQLLTALHSDELPS